MPKEESQPRWWCCPTRGCGYRNFHYRSTCIQCGKVAPEERPPATGLCTPAPGLCTPAPGLRTSAGAPPAIRAAPAPSIAPAAAAALLLKVPTVAQNPEFLKELEKVVGETITRLRKEVGEKEEEIEKKQKMLADVKGELALFEAMEVAHWI